MSGPEFFQNPDCPVRNVQILVCMTIMTKKYKKKVFLTKLSMYSLFNTKLYHIIIVFFRISQGQDLVLIFDNLYGNSAVTPGSFAWAVRI